MSAQAREFDALGDGSGDDEIVPPLRPEGLPADRPWPPKWREYPKDHPAWDEKAVGPWNEDWAREDFGDQYIDRLMRNQRSFAGDWWPLALLWLCQARHDASTARRHRAGAIAYWNAQRLIRPARGAQAEPLRLEYAEIPGVRMTGLDLREAYLGHADLTSADLTLARFDRAHLDRARLDKAFLKQVDFSDGSLAHSSLNGAHLTQANLSRVCLEHSQLSWATLDSAILEEARVSDAVIVEASMRGACLSGACLSNATISGTTLDEADLRNADLRSARLVRCSLVNAQLGGAICDGTDVRGSQGILFDSNQVDRVLISGDSRDAWSVLRREYTGPRYFVNLMLLVAFLLPFTVQVFYLTAMSEVQRGLLIAAERAERVPDPVPCAVWAKEAITAYREGHEQVRAWWVLVGGSAGWLFVVLTVVVVAYNGLRLVLTAQVSMLRDAEERSKVTPALEEYYGESHPLSKTPGWRSVPRVMLGRVRGWWADRSGDFNLEDRPEPGFRGRWKDRWRRRRDLSPIRIIGLYRLHQIARVLFWGSILSFSYHLLTWLITTRVWVPK